MLQHWRLKFNNGWVRLAGLVGIGLLPCPDCGVPLAVHLWPAVAIMWLWRRLQRRSLSKLDLLLPRDQPGNSGE